MKLKAGIFLFAVLFLCFSCIHRKHKNRVIEYCIASGSNVRMADGKELPIENLKSGDFVLAFNRSTNTFVSSKVLATAQTAHEGFVKLVFSNTSLIITNDHPVWVKTKGWCSVQPEITKRSLGMKEVKKLEAGDVCFSVDEKNAVSELKLNAVEKIGGIIKAYTIVSMENGLDCFVAEKVVVGVEPRQLEDGGE